MAEETTDNTSETTTQTNSSGTTTRPHITPFNINDAAIDEIPETQPETSDDVASLKSALAAAEKRREEEIAGYMDALEKLKAEHKSELEAKDAELAAARETFAKEKEALEADVEARAAKIAAEKYGAALEAPATAVANSARSVEELKAEYEKLKLPGEKSTFVAALSDAEANALIEALKK